MILSELIYSAQDNREFMKVLHILQNDAELRPLIFEHEALLRTLKDMRELKAE
jgi:mRNA-degrading endonuclease YafQ of YafQ-DinJ toxin-antitoxin module